MVAVTAEAVLRRQMLMKGRARASPGQGRADRRPHADIRDRRAGHAPISRRAPQRRMAGKAIRRELGMRRRQRPGAPSPVLIRNVFWLD